MQEHQHLTNFKARQTHSYSKDSLKFERDTPASMEGADERAENVIDSVIDLENGRCAFVLSHLYAAYW